MDKLKFKKWRKTGITMGRLTFDVCQQERARHYKNNGIHHDLITENRYRGALRRAKHLRAYDKRLVRFIDTDTQTNTLYASSERFISDSV